MSARIGIITVRGMDYHPTRRLAEAAQARDAAVIAVHPYRVWPMLAEGRQQLCGHEPLESLDAVLPRQGAEIKSASLALIAHFEQMGIPVINRLSAILTVRHKFLALQTLSAAGLAVPATLYATSADGYRAALEQLAPGPIVVKPISGRQGTGVVCLKLNEPLPEALQTELASGNGLLVQAFIPPGGRQDLRVLVVGSQVAGAMALTPAAGEFRANVHLGGEARSVDLQSETAAAALAATRAVGLEIAGVDLMLRPGDSRPLIGEVNYAPGFRGLEAATGRDIAGTIIDFVLSRCRKGKFRCASTA
jgi:ribosomal protein S6--L-glutamate ligase